MRKNITLKATLITAAIAFLTAACLIMCLLSPSNDQYSAEIPSPIAAVPSGGINFYGTTYDKNTLFITFMNRQYSISLGQSKQNLQDVISRIENSVGGKNITYKNYKQYNTKGTAFPNSEFLSVFAWNPDSGENESITISVIFNDKNTAVFIDISCTPPVSYPAVTFDMLNEWYGALLNKIPGNPITCYEVRKDSSYINYLEDNGTIFSQSISTLSYKKRKEIKIGTQSRNNKSVGRLSAKKAFSAHFSEYLTDDEYSDIIGDSDISIPSYDSTGKNILYINNMNFEESGDLCVFNTETKHTKKILTAGKIKKINKNYSIKAAYYYDDDTCMLIIGMGFGTVSIGGELYIYKLSAEKPEKCFSLPDNNEIIDLTVTSGFCVLDVAIFNSTWSYYYNIPYKYIP